MNKHLENMNDDINPHREPPPRWFIIGCLVSLIVIVAGVVLFFYGVFGN
jgi:hypothetical protein